MDHFDGKISTRTEAFHLFLDGVLAEWKAAVVFSSRERFYFLQPFQIFPWSAIILIRLGITPSLIRLTSDCMFFENVVKKIDANSLKPTKKDKTEKSPKIIRKEQRK